MSSTTLSRPGPSLRPSDTDRTHRSSRRSAPPQRTPSAVRPAAATRQPRALLLENIHDQAAQDLRDAGFDVEQRGRALTEDELLDALAGVQVLGVRSATQITSRVLEAASELRAVPASGLVAQLATHVSSAQALLS